MLKQKAKTREQLISELYHVPENGKAEIVDGEVVIMSPTGGRPGRVGGKIYIRLDQYESLTHSGYAYPENVGFIVDLPNRGSFSPDAAYHEGGSIDAGFIDGAPVFAAEVRSESDYGPATERRILAKIHDYFAAGTLVVWDVDALAEQTVRVYRADEPDNPTVFKRGAIADAEPALPGWRVALDEILE